MVVRALIIRVCISKVVLGQFENDRDQNEQLARNFPNIPVEVTDLFPILFNDLMLAHVFPRRNVFVDVELLTVKSVRFFVCDTQRAVIVCLTISIFSFTPVSPIHRSFSLYPKYSPSAKLHGNLLFSSSGSLKKVLPILNWRRTRSSSRPVPVTTQKPTLVIAS